MDTNNNIKLENGEVVETTKINLNSFILAQQRKLERNNETLLFLQQEAERLLTENTTIVNKLKALNEPAI